MLNITYKIYIRGEINRTFMADNSSNNRQKQKLSATFREDLRHSSEIRRSLKQDFRELKEFYLDKEQKDRLAQMGWIKRTFFT